MNQLIRDYIEMWYILTIENYAYVETERNRKKNKGTKCSQLVNLGIRTHANSLNYSYSISVCLELHQNKRMQKRKAHYKKL